MIADTCHPIDLATFCEAGRGGRALPDRPVLVTFDDGYRSVFEIARPILRRYRIPAAVFVCSDPVRRQRLFWFDAVMRALGPDAVARLRAQPNEGWRDLAEEHDTPAGAAPHLAPMTETQVRQLADEGFAIGVHTATHARAGRTPPRRAASTSSSRAGRRSNRGRGSASTRWPTPSARRTKTTRKKLWRLPRASASRAGFTTRNDFARPNGART